MHVERLLTTADVAERCQISQRSVLRWIATGELEVVRLGRLVRVTELALTNFLHRNRTKQKKPKDVFDIARFRKTILKPRE